MRSPVRLIFDERREGYDPLVEFMNLSEKAGATVKSEDKAGNRYP